MQDILFIIKKLRYCDVNIWIFDFFFIFLGILAKINLLLRIFIYNKIKNIFLLEINVGVNQKICDEIYKRKITKKVKSLNIYRVCKKTKIYFKKFQF